MQIQLSKFEIRTAKALGKSRTLANQVMGVTEQKVGPQDGAEITIQGTGAEIAFCKAQNIYPDLQDEDWSDVDCVLPCGATVDIKHTERENGQLLVRPNKIAKQCDLYVLVIGSLPIYRIAGGIRAEVLFQETNIKNLGYGDTYAIDQESLWTIDNLVWVYEYEQFKIPSRGRGSVSDSDRPARSDQPNSFGFGRSSFGKT